LFSGEYWTGTRALALGLIDRIGDLRTVLRERFGEKVATPLIAEGRSLFGRRTPGIDAGLSALSDRPGLADDVISALEARAIWARYGL
jgi:serine protease SohB